MAANPIPVNIVGDAQPKPTKRGKFSNNSQYKFLQRVDGFGQYARIIFYADTLEQANSTISQLHSDKVFDNFLTHAYTKRRDGKETICVHGIYHLVSRDYDHNFLRSKLPKASISVSFYPEASYPQTKKQATEVLQEGTLPSTASYGAFDTMNQPQENEFYNQF